MDQRVAGVVLAAGESLRMGRPKQLLQTGCKTFLRHAMDSLLVGGARPVFAVLGHDADRIAEAAGVPPEERVINPGYRDGMFSSLLAGIDAAESAAADAVLVALVDAPGISPELVAALIAEWGRTGAPLVEPWHGAGHGHPVLLARAMWSELRVADPGLGAKPVIRRWRAQGAHIDWPSPDVLTDLDTPADLARWQAA